MKLKNKVALITGSASGIGRATALLFAEEGARVVIADLNAKGAEAVASEIHSRGGEAHSIRVDVADEGDLQRMVADTVGRYGRVDILVNNAGGGENAGAVMETEERDWNATIDVNLKGVFLAAKHALREMTQAGGGVVINIGSVAGMEGSMFMAPYAASKAGVISLTKTMALEYGPMNVRVNCICPGAIETPLFRSAIQNLPVDGIEGFLIAKIPLGRIGRPEDVAAAALFLASDDAAYVSGAILTVDGGFTAGKSGS